MHEVSACDASSSRSSRGNGARVHAVTGQVLVFVHHEQVHTRFTRAPSVHVNTNHIDQVPSF
jgi:hypothetical protein